MFHCAARRRSLKVMLVPATTSVELRSTGTPPLPVHPLRSKRLTIALLLGIILIAALLAFLSGPREPSAGSGARSTTDNDASSPSLPGELTGRRGVTMHATWSFRPQTAQELAKAS